MSMQACRRLGASALVFRTRTLGGSRVRAGVEARDLPLDYLPSASRAGHACAHAACAARPVSTVSSAAQAPEFATLVL